MPRELCDHICASNGTIWGQCQLDKGHSGRHTRWDFHECDLCGKRRRGRGKLLIVGGTPDDPEEMRVCFMCRLEAESL